MLLGNNGSAVHRLGYPPSSWKANVTHCACAFRVVSAKIPLVAAIYIAVLFPKQMAPLVVVTTRPPNMCQLRIRKPASTTCGTSSKRCQQFRFVFLLSPQDLQGRHHHCRRQALQFHRRRPLPVKVLLTSPLAWSFWWKPFPYPLPLASIMIRPLMHLRRMSTWGPISLAFDNGSRFGIFSAQNNSPVFYVF